MVATIDDTIRRTPADPRPRGNTLAEKFDPKANSLDNLRLIFATMVAVAHASAIFLGVQPHVGETEVAGLAVDAFFVLSGFLVASSFDRLGSVARYAWHRFLRIMPLFWIVLVTTAFVVAPLIAVFEGRPAASVFTGPDPAWRYAVENSLLFIAPDNFGVAGLPSGTAQPGVVNGALWTLFYEVVCYGLVVAVGLFGFLRRRRWVLLAAAACFAVLAAVAEFGIAEPPGALFTRFFLVFLLGVATYAYRAELPITGRWALVSLIVLGVSLVLLTDYRVLGAPAFAYLCMWATVSTPFLRAGLPWDLSYGMYVFHWPIETLLVVSGVAGVLGVVGYTITAVLVAALLACASWNLIEKPILSFKNAPLPFDRSRH